MKVVDLKITFPVTFAGGKKITLHDGNLWNWIKPSLDDQKNNLKLLKYYFLKSN